MDPFLSLREFMRVFRCRSTWGMFVWLALAIQLTGCDTLGKVTKFKNPVVPPPPPRINVAEKEGTAGDEQTAQKTAEEPDGVEAGIVLVSAEAPQRPVGEVAALVNGQPIFMDDLLLPYAKALAKAEKQVKPAEFQKIRRHWARRELLGHIQRQLLIQALRSKLKEEQIAGIEKHLDAQFRDEEQKKMLRVYGVTTPAELDRELRKQGSSLATLRTTYRNQHMSQQYMAMKSMPKSGMDRPDLLEYYQNHLEDYEYPGTVKWQQILLVYQKRASLDETQDLADKIDEELQQGRDFDEAAREYDEGTHAREGGHWGWTVEGSLASAEVEKALFELPLGTPSRVIKTDAGLTIVRALERKVAGRKSFEEVQAEIKGNIRKTEFEEAAKALLRELMENAVLEILIDEPQAQPSEVQPANFRKSAERS